MDDLTTKHLQDLYGLNPDIPHPAFQFPRLPPGVFSNPMFRVHPDDDHTKKQFLDKSGTINQQLQGFQHMYQQYAAGLLSMNSTIVPPGHPLYTKRNTVQTLQAENDRLFKENLELKKNKKKIDADKP